nr:hypothetical protein [Tanacetum cinerariifolium]
LIAAAKGKQPARATSLTDPSEEYYACATREASPKPKASARRKRGGSDSSTTPPTPIATPTPITIVAATPRLIAAAKGKQPARATSLTDPSEVERTEAEQLKIIIRRSRQEMHISQHGGFSTDEGTDVDDQDKGKDDNKESGEGDAEETESDGESEEEETREEEGESFDPTSRTPEDSEDDDNGEEDQGLRISEEERIHEEEEADELYCDTDQLQDSLQRENDEFLRTIDDNIKKIIKEQVKSQVKAQVIRILPRIEESVNAQLKAEVLTRSSHSSKTSYAVAADLSEMELKKILIDKMEGNKSIQRSDEQRNLYKALVDTKDPSLDQTGGQRDKEKTWISELAKQADSRSSFNELLDTPIDFSNFIMNRLGVDTLTPELLAGPTYELMRGSYNSLTELKYHLEEVYKAITRSIRLDQPRGSTPLPLIPDNQGRRVIPFAHFINNDLEYLRGDASSRKYTTSMTKTKAADYGHIKWIEDLVPRTMWIQEPLNYDKHALWGVSHWGRKRQQFYGFVVNRESALDVYSKRRIIAVTDLKIVEWHNYKHIC